MNTAKALLIISVAMIFSMGLVMVFNTTSAEVLDKALDVDTRWALIKQLVYGGVGVFLGVILYFIGYKNIIRLSPFLFFLISFLLVLVFVPKIGHELNGAKRWVGIGAYSFQPSEFAKYLIPVYFLYRFQRFEKVDTFKGFLRFFSVFIIPLGLIILEPDNGSIAIIFMIFVVLCFLYRIRSIYWAVPIACCIVLGGIAAYNMPHVPARIKIYLHPELDLRGKGHQPYQAKIAAGSGGLSGRGLGESMQKLNYLPEARSDYIAAIFAEEFGFIGMLGMISMYLIMTFSGFFIALRADDKQGFYFASIITFLISFQAFLNLGIVSGLLPSKGTTLPFFSQGGTSLIVNLMAVCLILSVGNSKSGVLSYKESI